MQSTIVAVLFGFSALLIGGCTSSSDDESPSTDTTSNSCAMKPPSDGDWDRWRAELKDCIAARTNRTTSSSGSVKGGGGGGDDFVEGAGGEARIEPPNGGGKSGSAKAGENGKSSSSATPGCTIALRCENNNPCVCSRPNMPDVTCAGDSNAADSCSKVCTCS